MRLYHHGDRGEAVLDIQDRLGALGFAVGDDVAGVFGDGTRDALSLFQGERGLPVDGIVGPETWRALVDAGYRLGDRMLYHRVPMMRGDDVAELQARLNSLGFDTGKVDGIFGPDTLHGLLDFQHNRGLAEDGIGGTIVATELKLVDLTAQKQGREAVRERQWLSGLPSTIAGQRVYIDPECLSEQESAATWTAAEVARDEVQLLGATPVLSRSIDTAPPARLRAQRANRLNVDLVLGFFVPTDREEAVFYFESEHSRSEAGMELANVIAARLDVPARGRTMPMLKETRSPAALVAVRSMKRRVGRIVAHAIGSMYEAPRNQS
ncbi:MAG: peptidoglycan-binding protein [Acidimicrobiia bacterium]